MQTKRALVVQIMITLFFLGIHSLVFAAPAYKDISLIAGDQSQVSAYWFNSTTESKIPKTIILYHQAGASALGEYIPIIPKLTENGFDVLAVDLRAGGNRFGGQNKTAEKFNGKVAYCDALPDMQAAIDWVYKKKPSGKIIVWGSSYSAGMVFRLGAENPDQVHGVIGFSPASGNVMGDCSPGAYLKKLSMRAIAFRPEKEMAYESVAKQSQLFKSYNIPYKVIKNGVHGSSMLVESRTKSNMNNAWEQVFDFLNSF